MHAFSDILRNAWDIHDSLLCVGLDTDITKIPVALQSAPLPLFAFNKAIIDATHDLICAYKPNSAFYEAYGAQGIMQLKKTCEYIRSVDSSILIILDAKRGDIGNTNEGYVTFAYEYLGVDAITLHPYLGKEANMPFLNRADKGCIFLCKTSNPGSGEFQNAGVSAAQRFSGSAIQQHEELSEQQLSGSATQFLSESADQMKLYENVAGNIAKVWNVNNNCMLVVGATYPEELKRVREIVGDMPILLPGIGAQGGDLEASLAAGLTKEKKGLIIAASRSILYASSSEDFADRAREETQKMSDAIRKYRITH